MEQPATDESIRISQLKSNGQAFRSPAATVANYRAMYLFLMQEVRGDITPRMAEFSGRLKRLFGVTLTNDFPGISENQVIERSYIELFAPPGGRLLFDRTIFCPVGG